MVGLEWKDLTLPRLRNLIQTYTVGNDPGEVIDRYAATMDNPFTRSYVGDAFGNYAYWRGRNSYSGQPYSLADAKAQGKAWKRTAGLAMRSIPKYRSSRPIIRRVYRKGVILRGRHLGSFNEGERKHNMAFRRRRVFRGRRRRRVGFRKAYPRFGYMPRVMYRRRRRR